MKKLLIILATLLVSATAANAQSVAIKNNLLADATTSLNLGLEVGFAKHFSAELYASWNPFEHKNYKQFRHLMFQPEFRYWTCESFNGLFFGVHVLGGIYNVGGIPFPFHKDMKNYRYQGNFYGAGVTIGYQWMISKRWNIEAAIGAGYVSANYDQYACESCGDWLGKGKISGFVPTRATLAFVFFFN